MSLLTRQDGNGKHRIESSSKSRGKSNSIRISQINESGDLSMHSTELLNFADFDNPRHFQDGISNNISNISKKKNKGDKNQNSSNGRASSRNKAKKYEKAHVMGIEKHEKQSLFHKRSSSEPVSATSVVSGGYDPTATKDGEWAKFSSPSKQLKNSQPTSIDSLDKLTNKANMQNSSASTGKIRPPYSDRHRSSSNGSAGVTYHHRSITPVKKNANKSRSNTNQSPSLSASSKFGQLGQATYRTRATSPLPNTNTNNNRPTLITPQHNKLKVHAPSSLSSSAMIDKKKRKQLTEQELKIKQHYEKKNYAFQRPGRLVDFKTIDLASRTAFETIRILDITDLMTMAEKRSSSSPESSSGTTSVESWIARMSPTRQHLEVLHNIYNITSTRQLCWRPSVSCEADPFYGWNTDNGIDGFNADTGDDSSISKHKHQNNGTDDTFNTKYSDPEQRRRILLEQKRRRITAKRYGWYKQIDPITYVKSTLPKHAPSLTNVRRRLPMRSDVGFPGATEEEITIKQAEIGKEAELEEISPRLIVMITSNCTGSLSDFMEDDFISPDTRDHLEHRLPGIPFAGKELAMTAYRNKIVNTSSFQKETTRYDERQSLPNIPSQPRPNPTSVFSPPIDATFSSSEMWRARAFSDRPVGMVNILVYPMSVQFSVGDIEPLVCTLALYYLPKKTTATMTKGMASTVNNFRGKISEDFCFPSGGNWKGLLEEKAGKMLARQFGFTGVNDSVGPMDESYQKGTKNTTDGDYISESREHNPRVKKAMFSYDPEAIPPSPEDPTGRDSLYIVMQVNKVTHKEATNAYMDNKLSKGKKNNNFPQSKSGLSFGMSKSKDTIDISSSTSADFHRPNNITEIRAGKVFDSLGTQFLTPICFGILPLFQIKNANAQSDTNIDSGKMQWPNGITQTMAFFSYPTKPESEEDFVARLVTLSEVQSKSGNIIDSFVPHGIMSSSENDGYEAPLDKSSESIEIPLSASFQSSGSEDSGSRWFGKMSRKNKTKSKIKKKSKILTSVRKPIDASPSDCSPIDGSAIFYTSLLGVDFTSVLLESPSFKKNQNAEKELNSQLPRLFVDASGDRAIMVNPETRGSSVKKRSNLIRLPPAIEPSGYSDSCEVREVLYLPPPLHYGPDLPSSPRTPLNVLFLYPRLIGRYSPHKEDAYHSLHDHMTKNSSYSIRVQLVEQSMAFDDGTGKMKTKYSPVKSIYNPSPGEPPLLQSVFTKIPLGSTLTKGVYTEFSNGIPLRDEVKLRLPDILDGSHFIQFTLFSINLIDDWERNRHGGLEQTYIAEALIPLSSSSRKEGVRVTTVIPNRLHRIKISDFEFKVETRLASTIHISDPAVAIVIRDFPNPENASNIDGRKAVASFSNILSKASTQAVTNHFLILIYLHMRLLVTQGRPFFNTNSSRKSNGFLLMMDNMKSLFEIFKKVKTKFNSSEMAGKRHFNKFSKKFLDIFDDMHFTPETEKSLQPDDYRLKNSHSSQSVENIWSDAESHEDGIDGNDKVVNVALQQNEVKMKHYETYERRLKNNRSTISVPFSRKALGASKIDRMKAEAELYESELFVTELFDDDETVVTASTWQSQGQGRLTSGANTISFSENFRLGKVSEFDARVRDATSVSQPAFSSSEAHEVREDTRTSFEKARSMAKRVNILAQVFMAPCVGPELSVPQNYDVDNLSRNMSKIIADSNKKGTERTSSSFHAYDSKYKKKSALLKDDTVQSCNPGSDVEEEDFKIGKITGNLRRDFSPYPGAPSGFRLRGSQLTNLVELSYSLPDSPNREIKDLSDEKSLPQPYIYETIFALWVQCLNCNDSAEGCRSFLDNMDFLLPLCLKSIVLRCVNQQGSIGVVPLIVFDTKHMKVLDSVIQSMAEGLITSDVKNSTEMDLAFSKALYMNDFVLEFLVGLLAVIHTSQVSWVITRYLDKLRECENDEINSCLFDGGADNSWVTTAQYRIRSSRQLRLRVVEKLSSLPKFIALNFPLKYSSRWQAGVNQPSSWTNQALESLSTSTSSFPFSSPYSDGFERLPETHWLAELLSNECFIICSRSCEAIVTETISQIKGAGPRTKQSSMRKRATLSKAQLAQHQSTALHAITAVYELLLRNHAIDTRYQTEDARSRISSMFVRSIMVNSINSLPCLSKLDPMHKVRTIWLLCVLYISQEAPEVILREQMRNLFVSESSIKEGQVHDFICILKLCTSTFQGLITGNTLFSKESDAMNEIYPWLTQESFNTISAITILLLEESDMFAHYHFEQKKMVGSILDLLLHIISTPQSSVTLLRALGAASHALDKVGATYFLDVVDESAQHWGRMIFTLMNSTSLSVRTMSVDLTVSLFGGVFKDGGNIDEITLIFLTILPEVVAREIALYSIDGHIQSIDSIECSLWPMRRAIADIEDTDPLDDERVDAQLSPFLGQFCRACQAIIDGVLIELRLQGEQCSIVGTRINMIASSPKKKDTQIVTLPLSWAFDADEESLHEASSFFIPETGPMQRLRWLLTLKSLHELKGQWVEAAESSILCAKTIAESIAHVKDVWRPARFSLWNDHQQAPWLSTIGMNNNGVGNRQVMEFADSFLEHSSPQSLFSTSPVIKVGSLTERPTISFLCKIVTAVSKAAFDNYDKEGGIDSLAFTRLEQLLKIVMNFVDEHALLDFRNTARQPVRLNKAHNAEQNAALRKMSATINELVTKLAEKMLLLAEEEGDEEDRVISWKSNSPGRQRKTAISNLEVNNQLFYVRMLLTGTKPKRFQESTTIPTFLDWETPYICRVPKVAVLNARRKCMDDKGMFIQSLFENEICRAFAEPYLQAMQEESPRRSIEFYTDSSIIENASHTGENVTYLIVTLVHGEGVDLSDRLNGNTYLQSKKFCFINRLPKESQSVANFTEITVAHRFPTTLSRQSTLITTEFVSSTPIR